MKPLGKATASIEAATRPKTVDGHVVLAIGDFTSPNQIDRFLNRR